ncbi:MAG: presenilin family intramembrane aspartyl protease [Candidatus Nanoarchaeia archaeon]
MKHSLKILAAFMALFVLSQVLGLYLLSLSVQGVVKTETPSGTEYTTVYTNTSIGERPEVEGYGTLVYIVIGVIVGTVLLLLIARYNKMTFWKVWFFLAAWMTMSISVGAMLGENLFWISWLVAAGLAFLKLKYPHPIIHNLTELLMYAGIAVLLAPILSVIVAIILLILISIYDAYAVWKSKHMITMAEFTKKSNLFPGLSLTYTKKKDKTVILSNVKPAAKEQKTKETKSKTKARTGILGGGDVVFPLLFSGAVFTHLLEKGFTNLQALSYASIISLGAAVALFLLFYFGRKERYYPAMPFITAGCLFGFGVMNLVLYV